MTAWRNLRLSSRFMILVGAGVIALVIGVILVIGLYQRAEMERQLRALSVNEMTSLHALIVNVMAKRPEDAENIGIHVFNAWFDSRNIHYPGKVWSAWGPEVVAYMADAEPDHKPKLPVDDIDREAFQTKQPVGRLVNGAYRYAYPIVLGVTEGADQEVCFSCHGGMGMETGSVIAVLSSSLSTAEADSKLLTILLWLTAGGVVATINSVLCVRWILQSVIAKPIGAVTARMKQLAEGDVSVEIAELDRRDEIGDIARAVQVFKDNAVAKLRMEAEAQKEAEARDERMRRLESLIGRFEGTVATVLDTVASSAETMTMSARRLVDLAAAAAGRADTASTHASEASDNVRMVAAAAEELSNAITEIAQQVATSNQVAASATKEAESVNTRVSTLAGSADTIGQIIGLITGIAEQTNLLALNATVEAARAGDAGKGFAVVAGEVKNLARQTVNATDDISAQVSTIQDETHQTVSAIKGIGNTIARMDGVTTAIAAAIERQGNATREIAHNIDNAANGTGVVCQNIGEVGQAISDTDRSARDVLVAVELLQTQAATLRREVDDFLTGIRNA